MTIAFTNLGASANPDINDGGNATSYANTSWTPPTDGVIILFVHSRRAGGPDTPTVSGNNLTWLQKGTTLADGDGGGGLSLFIADASGATTGATTIDFGANTQVHCVGLFMQVQNIDISGGVLSAIVQAPTNTGSGTTGTVTLSAAGNSNNRPVSFFWHLAEEAITPRTNWTEFDDVQGGGRTRGCETQIRDDSFETTASATWTTSVIWAGIAAELKAAAGTVAVNKDLTAQYDILNLVNKDLAGQYDILNLVNKDLTGQWDIFILVNKDLVGQWDILNLVNKDLTGQWDMAGVIYKDLTGQFDIRELVNKDLQGQWDIDVLVNKDLAGQYDILNLVSKDLTGQWDMAGVVYKDLTGEWDILGASVIGIGLWNRFPFKKRTDR